MARLTSVLLAMIFLSLLAGCQMASDDDALPPPQLSAPVVGTAAPYVPRMPNPPMQTAQVAPTKSQRVPLRPAAPAVPAGWIPPVAANQWTWIIIHHSDSDYGSAAIIDQWHRVRGFDELGYHFVIGNGTNSGNGQVEVGPRWTKQKWGAHDNALDNRYNEHGIGICLVGNFDKTVPTAAQKRALVTLVAYLMQTYNIPPSRVLGHGDTKTTDCPGKNLNVAEIRSAATRMLADAGTLPVDSAMADVQP